MRRRFTLRVLLFVVTIAAVGLCVWQNGKLRASGITELQVDAVRPGMSKDQIEDIVGRPWDVVVVGRWTAWNYRVQSPPGVEPGRLSVRFGKDGRVDSCSRSGWISLPPK